MNKIKKIIIFIMMIIMVFTINVNADDTVVTTAPTTTTTPTKKNNDKITCKSIENSAKEFKENGEKQFESQSIDVSEITSPIVSIVQMLITAGILIIGIIMVILGIQWVMAKPSPEAQAKLKKQFVSLAVAAGVLFGSYTIWSLVVTILDSIDG